jgi:hypothetical protein
VTRRERPTYSPLKLDLEGTLSKYTAPGAPNYESVEKGDAAESVFILTLDDTICVGRGPTSDVDAADSMHRYRFAYDERGRLRWMKWILGAVNGTRSETRIYFAPSGKRLRTVDDLLEGSGYPSGMIDPVFDPVASFDVRGRCPDELETR